MCVCLRVKGAVVSSVCNVTTRERQRERAERDRERKSDCCFGVVVSNGTLITITIISACWKNMVVASLDM